MEEAQSKLTGSRADIVLVDDIVINDPAVDTKVATDIAALCRASGSLFLMFALSRKAQNEQHRYRGHQQRGIGARAYARSQGFDNMKHMVRVMAARRALIEQITKAQQPTT